MHSAAAAAGGASLVRVAPRVVRGDTKALRAQCTPPRRAAEAAMGALAAASLRQEKVGGVGVAVHCALHCAQVTS